MISINKIFFFGIIIPLVTLMFGRFFVSPGAFNVLAFIYIFGGIIVSSSICIAYVNFKSGKNSPLWYVVSFGFSIASSFYMYAIYSLSRFGF